MSNFVEFNPLRHKILAIDVLGFCFEHYSLGGATPQMTFNELGSYRPRDSNRISHLCHVEFKVDR